jgi:hypothetical protein
MAAAPALSAARAPEVHPPRLNFPAVWNGESRKLTLRLASPANGYVSAKLSDRNFRIAELRAMGGGLMTGGGPIAARLPSGAPVTHEPFEKSVEAGQEIQVDVVFEPKFSLENVAGPKSASLQLAGPGAASSPKWSIPVSLAGTFSGIRLGVTMTSDEREIYLVEPEASFDVTLTFVGTDVARKGTLRGQNLPAGVSLAPQPLAVPPGQTMKAVVRLQFNWGSFRKDGVGRPGEIVFEHDGGSSKAGLTLTGLPAGLTLDSGFREDCGITTAWMQLRASPGKITFYLWAQNASVIKAPVIWGEADAAGERIWGTPISVNYAVPTVPVLRTINSDMFPPPSREDYAKIVRGPVTFRCQAVKVLAPPENQPK